MFLAAFSGDLFTYCVTSLQLAMAYPSEAGGVGASAVKFLGVFAPTQLPLAVMGRTSYGCDRDRTGVLCKTGTQSRWIFKGGKVG